VILGLTVVCDVDDTYIETSMFDLKFYIVRGVILECLKSYMNNRKQRVDLEFIKTRFYSSGWETVHCGVRRALFWDSCFLIYTLMIFQKLLINSPTPYCLLMIPVFLSYLLITLN